MVEIIAVHKFYCAAIFFSLFLFQTRLEKTEKTSLSGGRCCNASEVGLLTMVDPIYQVPNEVRDFAEKSVEQARKAFEGFAGAAQKALHSSSDLPLVPPEAKDMGAKAFSYAEANVNAAFDLAQKLVHAKDPQEVFQLQSEFVKIQLNAIQEQTKELGAAFQRAATKKS
jgi:phasin